MSAVDWNTFECHSLAIYPTHCSNTAEAHDDAHFRPALMDIDLDGQFCLLSLVNGVVPELEIG